MRHPILTSVCVPLDTGTVARFFSRYPAAISLEAHAVAEAVQRVADESTDPGSRERRRAQTRYSNPAGDAFAICHCSARPEKLVLLASIVDVLWTHDDVTEEMTDEEACREHDVLREVLRLDVDPSSLNPKNKRQKTLASVIRQAIDIDPTRAAGMLEVVTGFLDAVDSKDDDFNCMEDYEAYRIANCGYWMSSYFIRWGMDITLDDDDYESIQQYDTVMGNVLGLTNDYFSWNVEKVQQAPGIRNAVRVLMKQHGISGDAAKTLLLGMIIEEEGKAARLKQERLKKPVSEEVLLYFEAIEVYVGGSCYWHATAPRYQIVE
ncbi:Terpene synthase [Tolypocladium paradoxum]|uniref:Terpene synthase n=1 Tax=Tolypocladium paradoxum TaxID=94208 RepID=A0A2S4KLF5_9HYPO|nr:Terpene synthase [Tolypocladium paradoxum]